MHKVKLFDSIIVMQKTTPWETKIAWLAGIIDGEGTIGCYFYHEKTGQSPRYGIWIINTDKRIIDMTSEIFRQLGATKVFTAEKVYKKNLWSKNRMWYVQVNRKLDVKLILEAITPYLVSKQEQAQLILNFFNDFPNLLYGRGNRSGKRNENFQAYNLLIEQIKQAKKKILVPVETK